MEARSSRAFTTAASALLVAACALGSSASPGDAPILVGAADGCTGLECKRVDCAGKPRTRITGRVLDPAGLRGIYNVSVYIPNGEPAPVLHGVRCDACQKRSVGAVASALTDARGEFVLDDVPADADLSIVIEIGRWRRVAKLTVPPCSDTRMPDDGVRLPRSSAEGELPLIAATTGASDALECLLRNAGIDDREFVGGGDERGRVHLYRGKGGGGLPKSPVPAAADLWSDPVRLARYDIVALSCEGDEAIENKGARDAIHGYANAGGHVFATHFQYTWLKDSPAADFRDIATWDPTKDVGDDYTIDTSFPKGQAFADWLSATGASTELGKIRLDNVTDSLGIVKQPPAQTWIRKGDTKHVRYFSFNTPIGMAREAQCGRVVFGDLHAFGLGGSDFPQGCLTAPSALSPQQLALEFLLFDLFACVDDDRERPTPPH
jgi:hypothetical protein